MKFKNLKVGDCFTFKTVHPKDENTTVYMKTIGYNVRAIFPNIGIKFNSVVVYGDKIGHIRYVDAAYEVERE